jgi:hypothetical protein
MTSSSRVAAALLVCVWSGLVAWGCGGKDSRPAGAAPSSSPAAAPVDGDEKLPASARSIVAWLPGAQPVAGWTRAKAAQAFGPDDLWEAIDGAAEAYLAFDVRELVMASCAKGVVVEAAVEVYRMADPLGAFGIYAQERSADGDFKPVGAEGYRLRNVVNFWSGPYYVKLRATTDAPAVSASLVELASRISERIGAPPPPPPVLATLPATGQAAHTIKYVPRDVLGQRYLSNAVEAQYRDGRQTCRLVRASLESPAGATDALARFKAFVGTSGRVTRSLSSPGEGGFVATSPLYGSVVAVRSGSTLLVALGGSSEKTALDLIVEALNRTM